MYPPSVIIFLPTILRYSCSSACFLLSAAVCGGGGRRWIMYPSPSLLSAAVLGGGGRRWILYPSPSLLSAAVCGGGGRRWILHPSPSLLSATVCGEGHRRNSVPELSFLPSNLSPSFSTPLVPTRPHTVPMMLLYVGNGAEKDPVPESPLPFWTACVRPPSAVPQGPGIRGADFPRKAEHRLGVIIWRFNSNRTIGPLPEGPAS